MGPAVFFLSPTKEGCTMSVLKRMPTKMPGATGGVQSRPIMTKTGREDIASQRMVNEFFFLSLSCQILEITESCVIFVVGPVVLWLVC